MSFDSLTGIEGIEAITLTLANHGGRKSGTKKEKIGDETKDQNKLFGIRVRLTRCGG